METTPDKPETPPESSENKALAEAPEKEAEKASTKGAKEAYGIRDEESSKQGSQSGFPSSEQDWQQVDDSTYKSKYGDTWRIVDQPDSQSLLYSETDWESLFSWSTADKSSQGKAFDENDWWYDFGLEDPFSSRQGENKEPATEAKQVTLLDSFGESDWGELELFFNDAYSEPAKPPAETAKPAEEAYTLPDGSRLATDGSWVELSPEAQRLSKEAGMDKPIVHKYVDKNGQEATLEIQDGRVFQVAGDGTRTEITDKRITVAGTDGTVTSKNKDTGEITSVNSERGVSFEQGPNGQPRRFTKGDLTIEENKGQFVITDKEGRTQVMSKEQIQTLIGSRRIVQNTGTDAASDGAPPRNPVDVQVNEHGKAIRDKDGTIISFHREKHVVSVRFKDGPEVLIDRQGNARIRTPDGQIVGIDRSNLPAGASIDEHGNIKFRNGLTIGADGRVRTRTGDVMDSRTGDLTVKDDTTGESVTVTNKPDGSHAIADTAGRIISSVNPGTGEVTTTTSSGETITFNTRTGELRTPDITMTPGQTVLWDGTHVHQDGGIVFANGTEIDPDNDVHFYDGTEVDEDGHIHTADGKEFNCHLSHGDPARTTPDGIAAYANAIASAIAGKANPEPGDVAALQAALGVLGPLLSKLTESGCLEAYAKLKDSQGNILAALAHAQGRAPQAGTGPQNDPRTLPGSPTGTPPRS